MKFCFSLVALAGLAVWNVGCGSSDTESAADPISDLDTELGETGGMDTGSTTPALPDDTGDPDTDTESGGPELPESTDE